MTQDVSGIPVPKVGVIPWQELRIVATRSPGPGGQNVNKVNTRITVSYDLANSSVLTQEQKQKISETWPGRISREGLFQVTASQHRTQSANKQAALERLAILLTEALTPKKARRKTRVPKGVIEKRIQDKKQRSKTKQLRGRPRQNMD